MRMRLVLTAVATAGALAAVVSPVQAAEYTSSLKIKGVQYDAPGTDSNKCSSGNTKNEYLTIKNYARTARIDLKGYAVKDAAGTKYTFTASHVLEPGDYVKQRGGKGPNSDAGNVVYRQNCNFLWNNDKDTIHFLKPGGAGADSHAYTKRANDRDGNGYIGYHN
ncbi:lamin tail domain-containing protein [Streptomyces beigongshangae]|uniref:lamin tail domain-containing protein n=1 Tax=Streptomyces beigongshangae TaxID=2841597 RepID=UPI001C844EA5|nr:lamin tail domain-containing protein [Streptomyces sp. REN17]